jgi:hypothetical protein
MDVEGTDSQERTAVDEVSSQDDPVVADERDQTGRELNTAPEQLHVVEHDSTARAVDAAPSELPAQARGSLDANGHSGPTDAAQAKDSPTSVMTLPAYKDIQVQPCETSGGSRLEHLSVENATCELVLDRSI